MGEFMHRDGARHGLPGTHGSITDDERALRESSGPDTCAEDRYTSRETPMTDFAPPIRLAPAQAA